MALSDERRFDEVAEALRLHLWKQHKVPKNVLNTFTDIDVIRDHGRRAMKIYFTDVSGFIETGVQELCLECAYCPAWDGTESVFQPQVLDIDEWERREIEKQTRWKVDPFQSLPEE